MAQQPGFNAPGRPAGTEPKHGLVLAWLAVVAWAGVILGLGSASYSAQETSRIIGPLLLWLFPDLAPEQRLVLHDLIRKAAHLLEYGLLAWLGQRAGRRSLRGTPAVALALGIVLAVAGTDETRQSRLEARTGTPRDVAIDFAGGLFGLGLAAAAGRLRRRHAPSR